MRSKCAEQLKKHARVLRSLEVEIEHLPDSERMEAEYLLNRRKLQLAIREFSEIKAEHDRLWDLVLYLRHRQLILAGKEEPNDEARRIEEKYGWENLLCRNQYDFAIVAGR